MAFSKSNTYFENQNTCLLGLSIDSTSSHLAWLHDIYCMTGIIVPFPIISDRSGEIARKYGMISTDISNTETVRNVFIIDETGKIRTILVYPMNVGRWIPEIIRIIQALQTSDRYKVSTPANWVPYNQVIVPSPQNFNSLIERKNENIKNQNGMNWYLSFKDVEESC